MTAVLIKRDKIEMDTQGRHVMMGTETGVIYLQTKECQPHLAITRNSDMAKKNPHLLSSERA